MAIVRNILVRVGADINPMQKNMAKGQAIVNNFGKTTSNYTRVFGTAISSMVGSTSSGMGIITSSLSMAQMGYVGLAIAGVTAFGAIAKASVTAAMKTVESENLFQVSMGNMAGAARQWSNDLQKSLGLNAYNVRENVGLFYNMTTSMGVAQQQAYKVSTGITKLAYDMASFYNTDFETMFTKLQSGISGEMEPLRRLGVIVSETVTQQYAYTHGIAKQGAVLTEAQKVMARYGTIMEQTKNAQGDLARTIKSPANQIRILQTQFQLAAINIGNAFMPLVERVLPIITQFATGLANITNIVAQFSQALFGSNSAQAQNAIAAAGASAAQTKLGNTIKSAGDKAKKGLAGFDEINQLQKAMAVNSGDAADAIGNMPLPAKQDSGDGIAQGFADMAKNMRESLTPASDAIKHIMDRIAEFKKNTDPYLKTLSPFLKFEFAIAWSATSTAINGAARSIDSLVSGGLSFVEGSIKTIDGLLSGDWKLAWDGAKQSVDGLSLSTNGLIGVLVPLANPLQNILDKYINHTKQGEALKSVWSWFRDNTATLWTGVQTSVGASWTKLKTDFDKNIAPVNNVIKSLWNFINEKTQPFFSKAQTDIATAWNNTKKNFDINWPAMDRKLREIWGWINTNAAPIFNGTKTTISRAFTDIGSTATSVWEGIKNTVRSSINSVISSINSFIRGVNSIKITIPQVKVPGTNISLGGGSIGFPQIPQIPFLANGAVINSPTLAVIAERRREAVVPLDNSSFTDELANKLVAAMPKNQTQGNSGPQTLILKVGESELGRIVINAINNYQRQHGVTLLEV